MPANNANAKAIVQTVFTLTPHRVTSPRRPPPAAHICRNLHNSSPQRATPLSVGVVGPPPNPPLPATPQYGERIERRRKQAEMLRQAKEFRSSQDQKGRPNPLKKRFWKDMATKSSSTPAPCAPPTRPSSPSRSRNRTSPTPSP
ncbi:hypothetical protein EPUS_03522 [Endocarpon pusillum Z07020]|uniref:Uncharacterized protein n=1 Tax=Endocarpon pusillum (strain Z07020 / HMAS-L-300199) TaxID=1263415 RepID=U1HID7_ENDPU|nr:uncharacterized protein EPUS_03522 [Endocarpon pusillum Z07020]ERF69970.1 hypothetical protein EPUS_03522 [Endocarpon pusillum Z07020]